MCCRVNGQNVFDLSLYVSLHALSLLEGKTCVTPFPNASRVPPFEEDGEPFGGLTLLGERLVGLAEWPPDPQVDSRSPAREAHAGSCLS